MSAQTYNAAVDMVDRNVAEGRGAKIAFSDPARRISYGKLAEAVARVGPMLAKADIAHLGRTRRTSCALLSET